MHHTADFRDCQRARGLLNYFQREGQRHWPITAHTGFKRFSLDQFHGIETLAILLSVISHPSNVWMMNVRSRARFAQKTRPRAGIVCHAPVDDLKSNSRVQHSIASAVSYRHRSRPEFDREAIGSDLHFEVGIPQWSWCQSTARRRSVGLFAVRQKAKGDETTEAFSVRAALSQRSATSRASPSSSRLLFLSFHAIAIVVVVHEQKKSIHAISI